MKDPMEKAFKVLELLILLKTLEVISLILS